MYYQYICTIYIQDGMASNTHIEDRSLERIRT